jgi:signal transduction histidine kinase
MFAGVSRLPEKVEKLTETVIASGKDHLPTLLKDAICFKFENQDHYYMPRIVLLRQEHEKSFGVAVILEEITQALLLDQVKTNLVSTVSHELKTPLTSIRMVLYLLLEESIGTFNEQQKNLLATAREDTDRVLRTLNDLLDLTRLEEGTPEMNFEKVFPRELLQPSIEHVHEQATAGGHRLTLLVEDNLPCVSVDRQRIAYVFDNLLANAAKYSAPGTTIQISANAAGQEHIRFAIKDEGPGIPEEYADRVFDKFFRVPGTRKMGTGLGLSIAREIVHANRGTIGVLSQAGRGSEFYVILPVAKEAGENAGSKVAGSLPGI